MQFFGDSVTDWLIEFPTDGAVMLKNDALNVQLLQLYEWLLSHGYSHTVSDALEAIWKQ